MWLRLLLLLLLCPLPGLAATVEPVSLIVFDRERKALIELERDRAPFVSRASARVAMPPGAGTARTGPSLFGGRSEGSWTAPWPLRARGGMLARPGRWRGCCR